MYRENDKQTNASISVRHLATFTRITRTEQTFRMSCGAPAAVQDPILQLMPLQVVAAK
jgi:hypothetical protein